MEPITLGGLLSSISGNHLFRHIALHLAAHKTIHSLINLVRKKGKRISRSQRRKFITRKRRWFTDNIIMHHRRLHQKNRDIVIEEPEKVIKKRKLKRKKEKDKGREKRKKPNNDIKFQSSSSLKHRGTILRGRVDSRRLKARSRWLNM